MKEKKYYLILNDREYHILLDAIYTACKVLSAERQLGGVAALNDLTVETVYSPIRRYKIINPDNTEKKDLRREIILNREERGFALLALNEAKKEARRKGNCADVNDLDKLMYKLIHAPNERTKRLYEAADTALTEKMTGMERVYAAAR